MTPRRPVLLGLAGTLMLVVVACSGSAATTAPSGVAGLPTIPPVPSLAIPSLAVPSIVIPSIVVPSIAIPSIALPSGVVVPSLPAGSFTIPSLPSQDKDLENRLPNAINGVTLSKVSLKGPDFVGAGGSAQQTTIDFLTALGKTPNDLSAAFASDPTSTIDIDIGAFRVVGTDPNQLLTLFVAATKKDAPQDVFAQVNVGGKNVTSITDPADTVAGPLYVYANGDTLFYAQTPDPALAAAALSQMP